MSGKIACLAKSAIYERQQGDSMAVSVGEKTILKGALQCLALHGFTAWRMNSGALPTRAGGFVRFGFRGCPDILGLVPGTHGRLLAVETKAPGKRPNRNQREVLEAMREAGAAAIWVDDLDTLNQVVSRLRQDPQAEFQINGKGIEDE